MLPEPFALLLGFAGLLARLPTWPDGPGGFAPGATEGQQLGDTRALSKIPLKATFKHDFIEFKS